MQLCRSAKTKTRRGKLLKALIVAICAAILGLGVVAGGIYAEGKQTSSASAQAALVLGAAVWGEEPSPVFRERIHHAIVLYHAGKVQKLLFTGGLGKNSKITESEAAKRYAIRQGVPASDILTEGESHTTWENLVFGRQVARQHQIGSFLLVTDPLHTKRAMAMAADLGLQASPSPTPTTRYKTLPSQSGLLMHETYFYLVYRLQRLL